MSYNMCQLLFIFIVCNYDNLYHFVLEVGHVHSILNTHLVDTVILEYNFQMYCCSSLMVWI